MHLSIIVNVVISNYKEYPGTILGQMAYAPLAEDFQGNERKSLW